MPIAGSNGIEGVNFSLSSVKEAARGRAGVVVVFEMDPLDGAEELVAAEGGHIVDRRDMSSHGRVLTFAGPKGNVARLFCRSDAAVTRHSG